MIFTGFKRKTNQIFFNKHLQNFERYTNEAPSEKVKSVLVLLSDATLKNNVLIYLKEVLKISENEIDFIIFQKNRIKDNQNAIVFTPKDFGWYGKMKSEQLQHILTKKYDLLINYSKVDNIYSNLLLLQCKTDFRVGFGHLDNRFYDLLIKCDSSDIELFNNELKKYLTILKKTE